MAEEEEPKAEPFALDLSECQVLWEEYATKRKLPSQATKVGDDLNMPNLHGAWIDGFLHSRGWRMDHDRESGAPAYRDKKAYEMHPQPLWALENIRSALNVVNDPRAIVNAVLDTRAKLRAATQALESLSNVEAQPIPMLLWCPECGQRHIDIPPFDTKLHHTHACQHCGMVWRPAICNTKGVVFLPGFKNEAP
jgi:hypothetical protein